MPSFVTTAQARRSYTTGSLLDLHCHTVRGSADSQLTPEELAQTARSAGLAACCLTEHDNVWDRHDADRFAEQAAMPVIRGVEVTTDLGHILVFGLDRYVSGIRDPYELRRVVKNAGGIMIAAHPFRNLLYHHRAPSRFLGGLKMSAGGRNGQRVPPSVEQVAEAAIFKIVDEVEVLNGATAELENFLALKVASHLGFKGVACSDAHSVSGIGRYVTVFDGPVTSTEDLLGQFKAGSFFPAASAVFTEPGGELRPYTAGSVSPELEARLQSALR